MPRNDACSRAVFAAMNVRRAARQSLEPDEIVKRAEASVEAAEACELSGPGRRRKGKRKR